MYVQQKVLLPTTCRLFILNPRIFQNLKNLNLKDLKIWKSKIDKSKYIESVPSTELLS